MQDVLSGSQPPIDFPFWALALVPALLGCVYPRAELQGRAAMAVRAGTFAIAALLALQAPEEAGAVATDPAAAAEARSGVVELDSREFREAVEEKAFFIDDREHPLVVRDGENTLVGYLEQENGPPRRFEFPYPEQYDIAEVLNEGNVPFTTVPQGDGAYRARSLFTFGLLLSIVLIILYARRHRMRRGGSAGNDDFGKARSFGKSRARRMTKDSPKVTFADVAGADEAVQELTEIKEFLESPQKFQ
ncbi:MAG: hypothetical protein M3R38_07850, partial [Actinomycetota bacterium]|nr:hypothetical protein [Actinomycetota bacterium]